MDSGVDVDFQTAVLVPSQQELQLRTVPLAVAAFPSKTGNLLVKALGSAAPLPDLKHLKRVRKAPNDGALLEAILCVLDDGTTRTPLPDASPAGATCGADAAGSHHSAIDLDINISCLSEPLQALYSQHGGSRLRITHGAAAAPQTRAQWDAWTKLWPITWRIPDHGTPVTEETPVQHRTQQYFERYMRAALQLASSSGADNAALLVDPGAQTVVAEAVDKSAAHPLQHAVMAAVQAASERDLALWPPEAGGEMCAGVGAEEEPMDAGPSGAAEDAGTGALSSDPGIPDAAATRAGLSDGLDAGRAGIRDGGDGAAGCELASKRPRLDAGPQATVAAAVGPSRPYMCTGYDCFVVREPCIMCAMALVHSRVQRVIYCLPDVAFGALGGCRRLHACKSLNHNYEVYRMEIKRST